MVLKEAGLVPRVHGGLSCAFVCMVQVPLPGTAIISALHFPVQLASLLDNLGDEGVSLDNLGRNTDGQTT
jgi:hypothetical protein